MREKSPAFTFALILGMGASLFCLAFPWPLLLKGLVVFLAVFAPVLAFTLHDAVVGDKFDGRKYPLIALVFGGLCCALLAYCHIKGLRNAYGVLVIGSTISALGAAKAHSSMTKTLKDFRFQAVMFGLSLMGGILASVFFRDASPDANGPIIKVIADTGEKTKKDTEQILVLMGEEGKTPTSIPDRTPGELQVALRKDQERFRALKQTTLATEKLYYSAVDERDPLRQSRLKIDIQENRREMAKLERLLYEKSAALSSLQAGSYEEAGRIFSDIAKRAPDDMFIRLGLSASKMKSKSDATRKEGSLLAYKTWQDARSLKGEANKGYYWLATNNLAVVFMSADLYDQAEPYVRELLKDRRKRGTPSASLGRALHQFAGLQNGTGKFADALLIQEEAVGLLDQDPLSDEFIASLAQRSSIKENLTDFAGAEEDLITSMALLAAKPYHPLAMAANYAQRSSVRMSLKKWSLADSDIRNSLNLLKAGSDSSSLAYAIAKQYEAIISLHTAPSERSKSRELALEAEKAFTAIGLNPNGPQSRAFRENHEFLMRQTADGKS
ncbi:MAG: hypothetical protein EON58_01955 [Alphaproteobacteria bacterium]|nr:MAG: hypothetical protein EON58_01955 [Alphaproteobacteria bacterium]